MVNAAKLYLYVMETLKVGSDIVDRKSIRKTYAYLPLLYTFKYSYGDIQIILGQNVNSTIRQLEYFWSRRRNNHRYLLACQ